MVSTKVFIIAACLLVLQICRAYGQSISSEAYSATSVSNPSLCGGQFVIPAVIKPVMQPESYSTPMVPDFGCGMNSGYGGCVVPPIIIEEGSSGGNDILWPLLMIFALRNIGGGGSGRGCAGGIGYGGMGTGCGGMNMGYGGMGMGYGGMGMGYGGMGYCGGVGGFGGYGGCGCGYSGGGGYSGGCGCNGGCGYNGNGGCNYPYSNGCDSCGCNDGNNEICVVFKTDSSSSGSSSGSSGGSK